MFQFSLDCDLMFLRCRGEEELNRRNTVFVSLLHDMKEQNLTLLRLSSSALNTCTPVARFQKASFLHRVSQVVLAKPGA